MVGVGVQRTVRSEGEDDVGAEGADEGYQAAGGGGEVGVLEVSVLVVPGFVGGDAENVAGGGELGTADAAEVFGRAGVTAIAGGLAVG